MHEEIINVIICGLDVWLCCQSHKTILEEEYAQRINTVEQDVQAYVKFQIVKEKRICNIFLSDTILNVWVNICWIINQVYAPTLAHVIRLNNESLRSAAASVSGSLFSRVSVQDSCIFFKLGLEFYVFLR